MGAGASDKPLGSWAACNSDQMDSLNMPISPTKGYVPAAAAVCKWQQAGTVTLSPPEQRSPLRAGC